jgi:predicted Zn-dependent protease
MRRPYRLAAILVILTSATLVGACVPKGPGAGTGNIAADIGVTLLTNWDTIETALRGVTEDKEIEMGRGLASLILGASPLVDYPDLQQYVNNVGGWIASKTDRSRLPWYFGVIEGNEINALAAPGGYIFVTKGLFLNMQDEAELAGVLSHEIVHVLQKHHMKEIQRQSWMDLGKIALEKANSFSIPNSPLFNALMSAGKNLYQSGLSQGDEYESDQRGVQVAAEAGYTPDGLPDVLKTLLRLNPDDNRITFMFKTHPPFAKRLTRLDKEIADKLSRYRSQPRPNEYFRKIQRKVLASL